MRSRQTIAVLALAWASAAPGHDGPTVKVPRGTAPVIDGRIDSMEWRGAAIERVELELVP